MCINRIYNLRKILLINKQFFSIITTLKNNYYIEFIKTNEFKKDILIHSLWSKERRSSSLKIHF